MSKQPEVISRGDFRCHIIRLDGGAIRLEAYFSPQTKHSSWHRVYPPHAISDARTAAHYFCRSGQLPTYRGLCTLRQHKAIPADLTA